jgi:hypothetical protein
MLIGLGRMLKVWLLHMDLKKLNTGLIWLLELLVRRIAHNMM